ncbi:Cytochrome P450 [Venustampulla echinocandica]|uniref:Cytochrome P450 n=1 Tax=Venustampulla echinocandica TaxID=2656787 RepID=A0A370TBZ7_9HELO|nr:Cytochrome P450 [Venustampulla echinocandica]RDL31768.1 Cytochrome P450 [Venustampulla echinocandica]
MAFKIGPFEGSLNWPTIVTAFLTLLLIQKTTANYLQSKKYKLPPRIPGLPIFGNTFQLPPMDQGLWGIEQAKKYGEMYTCKFGVNTWVFLNSSRVVNDLMEKRSAIYSSRQNMPMASGIMSGGCRILLMPYSDRWRAIRKVMHTILNKQNTATFAPFQDLESKHLLYDYLHNPEQWYNANQRFANSVIMGVVFGKRFELGHPHTRELLETSTEILTALQPGASLVDALPVFEKLPTCLQWWRPRGQRAQERCKSVYKREVADLEARVEAGTARECFALQFMKSPDAHKFGETQFLFALGSLMEAGSDTSRMTISQVIAAAALDKRWVVTARKALDAVCGSNAERLPDFADRENLPYLSAVTKEAFRWRPMAQIGFPTMLTQDDEYEGYKFPAGTIFTWNATAIALDEREYEEPMRFWPERFMNEDVGSVMKGHWSFGPGRRACSGYHVGDSNVWIAIARLLYCFDFEPIEGQPIDSLRVSWLEHRHAPFPVSIKVRSPQHAALVEREGEIAVNTKY